MTRKKRDTTAKRESILDAAVQEFQSVGYDGTSMDRVAEVAGASKRTVYNHFESKEALLLAVVDRLKEQFHADQEMEYDASRSLEEQLGEFLDTMIQIQRDSESFGLVRVAMGVFISNPEVARQAMERFEEEDKAIVTWMKAAAADDRLRIEDPARTGERLHRLAWGALFWPALFEGPLSDNDANTARDELLEMFLGRYRA